MNAKKCLRMVSASRDATVQAGYELGVLLRAGDVVAMNGDLGAGKTAMTVGIAAGLKCLGPVSSPTFVLQHIHPAGPGGLVLNHFDLYRLHDADDFIEAGFEEVLYGEDVCVLEWADIARDVLPPARIQILLSQGGDDMRRIEICDTHEQAGAWIGKLSDRLRKQPGLELEDMA